MHPAPRTRARVSPAHGTARAATGVGRRSGLVPASRRTSRCLRDTLGQYRTWRSTRVAPYARVRTGLRVASA
eukprot:2634545-Rhodomonas_salina.1